MHTLDIIYEHLYAHKIIYLVDEWEECAIKIILDEKNEKFIFWQKFHGKPEFRSHPKSKLILNALLDADWRVTKRIDGQMVEMQNTRIITENEYYNY